MNQHTPGPWSARGRGGMSDGGSTMMHSHFRGDIVHNRRTIISSSSLLGIQGDTPSEAEANARLIAAAPELLEACRDAVRVAYEAEMGADWVAQMRKAIAKAEGVDPETTPASAEPNSAGQPDAADGGRERG